MSVTWKLRGAFALYVALLAAVLLYHVRTVRQSVARGHALTATAARMRAISSEQTGRVAEMSTTAEKYLVTHDRGYLDKLGGLVQAYGAELQRLAVLPLSDDERARLSSLTPLWRDVEQNTAVFAGDSAASATPAAIAQAVGRVEQLLGEIHTRTLHVGEAARSAMTRQLAESAMEARNAERLSWLAALGALLLGAVLSALLVRSIVRPLDRLARGTREISAGRFGYRLEASGRDEFSQVAHEFNAMTARLDELEGMKREFVSNVSHDLKTPLSSMRETTELLLDGLPGPLTDKQRRLLQLNQEGGQRLAAMIAKLLDLSRLESAAPPAETVDLASIIRGGVERAAAARRAGGATIELSEPGRPLFVRADPDAIGQVLDNLLENAIKFSPDGPVRVSLAARDEHVVLSVADEGPGIPDADKERVFERFYQTKVGRAVPSRGVGLGLAICRQIVTRHGGTIRVTDNTPRGSVFTVRLPSAERPVTRAATVESAA